MSTLIGQSGDNSQLHLVSIGIAVKDKEKFSDELEIYLVELFPYVQGKIADQKLDHQKDMADSKGTTKSHTAKGSYTIKAKWLPDGSGNQITAPDVYKNESVKVFRYADTDKYFWSTVFREPKLRKQETVATMYSNVKEPNKEFDKQSSYWTQVDTRDKKWQLHTSKNDGEKCEFDAILDTKEGTFTLTDNNGNTFTLDTSKATWGITTNAGNNFTMSEQHTSMSMPGNCDIQTDNTTMTSNGNTTMNSTGDMQMNSSSNMQLSASQSLGIAGEGGSIGLGKDGSEIKSDSSMDVNAQDVTIEGKNTVDIKAGSSTIHLSNGTIDIDTGTLNITVGNLYVKGTLYADKIVCSDISG